MEENENVIDVSVNDAAEPEAKAVDEQVTEPDQEAPTMKEEPETAAEESAADTETEKSLLEEESSGAGSSGSSGSSGSTTVDEITSPEEDPELYESTGETYTSDIAQQLIITNRLLGIEIALLIVIVIFGLSNFLMKLIRNNITNYF